jgi:hypothetical protein
MIALNKSTGTLGALKRKKSNSAKAGSHPTARALKRYSSRSIGRRG